MTFCTLSSHKGKFHVGSSQKQPLQIIVVCNCPHSIGHWMQCVGEPCEPWWNLAHMVLAKASAKTFHYPEEGRGMTLLCFEKGRGNKTGLPRSKSYSCPALHLLLLLPLSLHRCRHVWPNPLRVPGKRAWWQDAHWFWFGLVTKSWKIPSLCKHLWAHGIKFGLLCGFVPVIVSYINGVAVSLTVCAYFPFLWMH